MNNAKSNLNIIFHLYGLLFGCAIKFLLSQCWEDINRGMWKPAFDSLPETYWFGLEPEAFAFIAQQRRVRAQKKVKAPAARGGAGQGFSQKQDILDEPNLKEIWTFCG